MKPAQKETHSIAVQMDGRRFLCHMSEWEFLRIYERVTVNAGTVLEGVAKVSRWHHMHNATPKRGLISRVMAEAIKKQRDI